MQFAMVECYICVFRLLIGLTLSSAAAVALRTTGVWKGFPLDNEMLRALGSPTLPSVTEEFADVLVGMVRAVNTLDHKTAQKFIEKNLQHLGWDIQKDTFEAQTPLGKRNFSNLIARLTPPKPPGSRRYLVLASHYDTKTSNGSEIDLDWTDGSIACAMLLSLATMLRSSLWNHELTSNHRIPSLMLIFFDGKEAFNIYSPEDSLYGSRHLAQRWEKEHRLQDIELLMLLNLMGTADPVYYSYWNKTQRWHNQLSFFEMRMARLRLLEEYKTRKHPRYFQLQTSSMRIDDDHVPFLLRGVPSLHLIPEPFPPCWPLTCTAIENLDWSTTANIERVLRAFIVSFLGLRRPIPYYYPDQIPKYM